MNYSLTKQCEESSVEAHTGHHVITLHIRLETSQGLGYVILMACGLVSTLS